MASTIARSRAAKVLGASVIMRWQIGDAGAGFFARFQVEQKGIAVGLDGARNSSVFGIEAGGDDAAVAHQRSGFFRDGALQQGGGSSRRLQICQYLSQIGL